MEGEEFLHALWAQLPYLHEALTTTEGSAVEVLSQGRYNRDAGPDFLNAQIVIDGIRWGGDVEIHLRASDWHLHGHDTDPAYNAVILHVVATYDADAITSQGRKLTTVVFPHLALYQQHQEALCTSLTKPPCGHRLAQLPAIDRASWLARLLVERLEARTKLIQNERKKCALDWEEAFYRSIARSLGQKVNSDPMERLAAHTPLKELYKVCDSPQALEAILHGQSGLLGQAEAPDDYTQTLRAEYAYHAAKYKLSAPTSLGWKFFRLRPSSFPSIRISQLASLLQHGKQLLSRVLEAKNYTELVSIFQISAAPYWDTHYRFSQPSKTTQRKALGQSGIHTVLLNSALPFRFAYAHSQGNEELLAQTLQMYEAAPPDDNAIVRAFVSMGTACTNAAESQALLELEKSYCALKRCYLCPAWSIGIEEKH